MRTFYTACPLCSSKSFHPHLTAAATKHPLYDERLPKELTWVECEDCLHVFTESYWDAEGCEIIFSKSHANQKFFAGYEQQRYVASDIIEWSEAQPPGAWLDIGVGNGALALTAKEFGFLVEGMETRPIVGPLYGVEMVSKIESVYEVISMMDVLEHVPFPKDLLHQARHHLTSTGILILSMPNSDSPLWKSLGDGNPYWWEIEHHHNFSRSRLYALLRAFNFTPIKYRVSKRYRACMEVIAR